MNILSIETRDICRTPTDKTYPRVFVNIQGETQEQNWLLRRFPMNPKYHQIAEQVIQQMGLPKDTKYRWDHLAGCELCPCSPGFVIEADYPKDFNVVIEDNELLDAYNQGVEALMVLLKKRTEETAL